MADADVQGLLIRIEATTAQLRQEVARGEAAVAQSAGKMDASLGRIDTAFDRAGESAQSAGGLIRNALAAAVGAASIGAILKTADSYSQMSDRIGLATKSFGEYNTVQERLLATANRTYRPLEEAQELYIRTSDSLRSMGLSADQSMDVMDSFSYLLVTNSASADKASSAIDAYSKSLQTGKIDADSWQAILAAMPTVVDTVSKATGKSAEEIRSLGAQGKLSLDTLTEGFQKSAEANGLLADSMGVAVRDALVALNNAFSVYVGQLNESTDFTGILAAGIGSLADNFGTLAEIAGVAAVGALAVYARSLAASTAGSVLSAKAALEDTMARRAQATSVLLAAQADQQKAQTAVFLAQKEAIAAKGTAVQTQLSLQLAEARMVESRATAAVGAAQAAIVGTGRTLLGLLGGPVGIAVLAMGAATAFITLRDNTGDLEKKLGDLSDPIEKLIQRFGELDRAGQSVTLRGLQQNIEETQSKVTQMSGAIADQFENDLRNMGAAGADGLMAGLVGLPDDVQAALDRVRKASSDQAAGITVDWKAVADELRLVPGVTEAMAVAIEASGSSSAKAAKDLSVLKDTVVQLTGETDELTRAQRENDAAKAAAAGVGQKYLEQLQKQLGTAQDKTALQAANRFIAENTLLTDEMVVAIRSAAAAKDAQKAADAAATKSTKEGTSAAKEAATEAKNQAKALTDLKTQADIAIKSATGLAAAYQAGTDKSREFSLQQKVDEALLKAGSAARQEVEKAINAQQDAQDKLNISKAAYDLGRETADIIAQAQATLMGADALAAYNVQKSMTVALAGKNIAVGSEEYKQLLAATEAQQEAVRVAQRAGSVGGLMDRLYPEAKLLKDYAEDQKALNAAMALYPENAANYQAALLKLGSEYEVNRSKATLWGQMTEGAIDRIDEAFATAWGNIGSGAESLWDNLKKGFKQTLGEIAHMLTTKPLLASISNWLTGADSGQGLSSVWGKLLGGSGESSGGGLASLLGGGSDSKGWGGMVSLGKNLYSAWSNLTGVGSSIAQGYATGGLSGAISGGAGYYGNILSNIASTLGSGFSSLIGGNIAITGATAAGTAATTAALTGLTVGQAAASAATVGAQGITTAALSAAVAEGAASVGTSIGVAGATTAAASSGISTAISSALSSAAAMWPLAIITGMYQSGKLYSAGVRPDASEMWASGGGTALGKAAMLPQTVGAKYFEIVDGAMGKLVGGKMAAILSGSTLFQAVWSKVGSKLFGGKWETKDGGLSLGVKNGEFEGQQYIYQKKKGGLFSSSKKRTRYSALEPDFQSALQETYEETEDNVAGLLARIGVSVGEGAFSGLNIARQKISTKGKTEDQIQAAINDMFSGFADQMVAHIDQGALGLGGSFSELAGKIAIFESFNATLDLINVTMLRLAPQSMALANSLVAAAGGLETYTQSLNTYFEGFFSDSERADKSLGLIQQQFKDMNVTLPDTREAYRKVVEALDLTTEAGQSMYLTLIGAAGSAAQAYDILEAKANAAAANIAQQLQDGLSNAYGAVQRAISAQQKKTTDAYNATNSSLNDMVSTVTEKISGLSAISVNLSGALKALRGDSDDAVKMLRAQAQATLQSALVTARSGKSLSGFTGLDDALDTVSSNNTDMYGSMEDFARDQGRTANVVAELNAVNGKQLTAAEKSLEGLRAQIDQAKKSYDLQMSQYDAQLTLAQAQIDALNGVDNSVISVAAAVNSLSQAVVASLAIKGDDSARQNTFDNNAAIVRAVYRTVLGRDADAKGLADWAGALSGGLVTYDELMASIARQGRINGENVLVPGFASGGVFSGGLRLVGERGPELEVTGPSRIYNASQTAAMLNGGGSNAGLVTEIRALGARLDMIQAETQAGALNGGKIVKLLDRVTDGGNAMLTKELA